MQDRSTDPLVSTDEVEELQVRPVRISDHFSLEEFHSYDEDGTLLDEWPSRAMDQLVNLVIDLETMRECYFSLDPIGEKRIQIVSAWRPPWRNAEIGGAANSMHMKALAVDKAVFSVRGSRLIEPQRIYVVDKQLVRDGKIRDGGLGVYPKRGTTHYDHGAPGRRWSGQTWKTGLSARPKPRTRST